MDPLQAIAAHQVSRSRKSKAEEVEAFYDNNAFETVHSARRELVRFARLLRASLSHFLGKAKRSAQIASAPRRA